MPTIGQPHHAALCAQWYDANHRWLQQWLRRRLGCTLDAADLVHDTFVRVLTNRDLTAVREPRAYLTTVAHGLMVNQLRRRALERAYLDSLAALPPASAPDPAQRAQALQMLLEIDALLDGLPPKARQAFLWFQLEGLCQSEIAQRLAVSVSSVKKYLLRATTQCLLVMA